MLQSLIHTSCISYSRQYKSRLRKRGSAKSYRGVIHAEVKWRHADTHSRKVVQIQACRCSFPPPRGIREFKKCRNRCAVLEFRTFSCRGTMAPSHALVLPAANIVNSCHSQNWPGHSSPAGSVPLRVQSIPSAVLLASNIFSHIAQGHDPVAVALPSRGDVGL